MSETVAAQPTTEPTPTAAQAEPDSTDWKAEARKWEDRSKSNAQAAKELREAQARLAQFEGDDVGPHARRAVPGVSAGLGECGPRQHAQDCRHPQIAHDASLA